MLAPDSVRVPLPTFVRLPPDPPIVPAKVVELPLPPAVSALSLSNTPDRLTPVNEPIVSELDSSSLEVEFDRFTALASGIALPLATTSLPSAICVPPEYALFIPERVVVPPPNLIIEPLPEIVLLRISVPAPPRLAVAPESKLIVPLTVPVVVEITAPLLAIVTCSPIAA